MAASELEVVVAAFATGGDGNDCATARTVELDAPLGDRVLVDGHRAAPVPVAPSP